VFGVLCSWVVRSCVVLGPGPVVHPLCPACSADPRGRACRPPSGRPRLSCPAVGGGPATGPGVRL